MNAITLYRMAHWLSVLRVPLLPKLLYYVTFLIFNSSIPPTAIIGKGSRFAYGGIGVVIHSRARIGERVVIGQGITIGGRSHSPEVPIIGDGAYLGAGSRILGAITIGAGSVVAPNAVVIADVPPRSIVGGVPARILKRDIDAADYV